MHAAIVIKEDASDNPNRKLGILAGCVARRRMHSGVVSLTIDREPPSEAGG